MKIALLIPGTGDTFYCENCLRDAGLASALRAIGHDAHLVPMYLPVATDPAAPADAPVFFGGLNVYLQQKSALFRRTPRWLDRLLDSRALLGLLARLAGMTSARDLGETTVSMLRGEHGRQVKELRRLTDFLARHERPDVVCLANALLAGLAPAIKEALGVPVVCLLQDEDEFLDALPEPHRSAAWGLIGRRAGDIDAFLPASRYYADAMARRLGVKGAKMHVVWPGVDASAYAPADAPPDPPAVGFLSRLCRDRGPDLLVEAFIALKRSGRHPRLRLRLAGGRLGEDRRFIAHIRRRVAASGVADDVDFLPNLAGSEKMDFLRSLSVLSVPVRVGAAFGFYVLEALGCGVPVVAPARGALTELLGATAGGILCEPDDPQALTEAIGGLLADPDAARRMALRGRQAVGEKFGLDRAAREVADVLAAACRQPGGQVTAEPQS